MPFTKTETYAFQGTNWNSVPAVYGIMNSKRQMIYIGQSEDLKRRMAEHQADTKHCMHRYGPALVLAEVIQVEATRLARERQLVLEYAPPCNQK
jgi:predicted GIY-YIG superfamily endonuclease